MQQQFSEEHHWTEELEATFLAHDRLLGEGWSWIRETESPAHLEGFAAVVAAAQHFHPDLGVTHWTRVRVACYLLLLDKFFDESFGCPAPAHMIDDFFEFMHFLSESDWLDDDSDRLKALVEPFDCHCGRDGLGRLELVTPVTYSCLCLKRFRGHSHGRVMNGTRW